MTGDLREVMKNQSFAEILLSDGDSIRGFVVKVGPENFHIVTLEPIVPNLNEDNHCHDEDGNTMIFQDPSEINFITTKHSYLNELVMGLVFDVSHRVEPELLKSLFFMRDNSIYQKKPTKKRTPKTNVSLQPLTKIVT